MNPMQSPSSNPSPSQTTPSSLASDSPHRLSSGPILSASALSSDDVYNAHGDKLGSIKEIMLDTQNGTVCCAVLACGGFLSLGEKLFALPWSALTLDTHNKRFVLNIATDRLKNAPGFDKDHWPNMADAAWLQDIHRYYGLSAESKQAFIPRTH